MPEPPAPIPHQNGVLALFKTQKKLWREHLWAWPPLLSHEQKTLASHSWHGGECGQQELQGSIPGSHLPSTILALFHEGTVLSTSIYLCIFESCFRSSMEKEQHEVGGKNRWSPPISQIRKWGLDSLILAYLVIKKIIHIVLIYSETRKDDQKPLKNILHFSSCFN